MLTLLLPFSFQDYTRRWVVVPTEGGPLAKFAQHHRKIHFPTWVEQHYGYDVERFVYDQVSVCL
jgi:hypothetical protein